MSSVERVRVHAVLRGREITAPALVTPGDQPVIRPYSAETEGTESFNGIAVVTTADTILPTSITPSAVRSLLPLPGGNLVRFIPFG